MGVIKIWPVNVREGEGAVLKPFSSSSLNLGDRSGVVRLSWLMAVLGRGYNFITMVWLLAVEGVDPSVNLLQPGDFVLLGDEYVT